MMYSQNQEEGVINSLFGDTGRFLDVGAFDGKTFSNTLRLYERGWSGVLVEPSVKSFIALSRLYDKKENVVLLNVAIAEENRTIEFYDSDGDAISSTDKGHVEKWTNGYNCKFTKVTAEGITWDVLFDRVGTNFDFVNIDTEGTNLKLLEMFPFNRCYPMCLCIEYDGKQKEMGEIMAKNGYRAVYQSGENIVYWRG